MISQKFRIYKSMYYYVLYSEMGIWCSNVFSCSNNRGKTAKNVHRYTEY